MWALNSGMRIASLNKRGTPLHIPKFDQIQSKSRTLCFGNFWLKKRKFAKKRNILIPVN